MLSQDYIVTTVERELPEFAKACEGGADSIILHQDAFGLSGHEVKLLGMAIKYAGIKNKNVTIVGAQEAKNDQNSD